MKTSALGLLLLTTATPLAAQFVTVLHPDQKFEPAQTAVWTPLFQASWDKLNEYHGGKPRKVTPFNELIDKLDRFEWKADEVLPKGRWKVWSGPCTNAFLAGVNAEAAALTGEEKGPFWISSENAETAAVFGLLDRELAFKKAFFRSKRTALEFAAAAGKSKVRFFGVQGAESESFGNVVKVLAYRPKDHTHALQIACREEGESVLLFRPPEPQSFATACLWLRTWRTAWKAPTEPNVDFDDPYLHARDQVRIPYLKLEGTQDLQKELDGNRFFTDIPTPRKIGRAQQHVKFELHERGAKVRAEVSMEDPFGGGPVGVPRNFSYDAPFFVFLWRDGAEWPYCGVWVGDASAMEKEE